MPYFALSTAARYMNEEAVGRAIKEFLASSKVSREELFITSKLWDADHERAADAIKESLKKLDLDYIDLYLIHSPGNMGEEARLKAWKDLEAAVDAGTIKSIGVSNVSVSIEAIKTVKGESRLIQTNTLASLISLTSKSSTIFWQAAESSPLSIKSNRIPSLPTKICERLPLLVVFTFKPILPWLKELLSNDLKSRLLLTSMASLLLKSCFDGDFKLVTLSCQSPLPNLVLKPMQSCLTLNWMPMTWRFSTRSMKV